MNKQYTINGRFLSQKLSGVQRYAREIVLELDRQAESNVIALPSDADVVHYEHLRIRKTFGRGYLWEQSILPSMRGPPILNLCNTAPLARADQVVCIHDANVFRFPEAYGLAFGATYRLLLPAIAKRVRWIATVSKASASDISSYLAIPMSKIRVLPNGREHVYRWRAANSNLPVQTYGRPYVLCLGSRAKHKNVSLIIGLAERLSEHGLDVVIAGGGGSVFAPEQLSKAGSSVRLLGTVSDDDLAALLKNALCLAFPSWTEGFGIPVLEAMVLGCPVISSDRASLPEVCGDAAILVDPGSPETWLDAILRVLASPGLRTEMIEKGKAQSEKFSWRETALQYSNLLRTL